MRSMGNQSQQQMVQDGGGERGKNRERENAKKKETVRKGRPSLLREKKIDPGAFTWAVGGGSKRTNVVVCGVRRPEVEERRSRRRGVRKT